MTYEKLPNGQKYLVNHQITGNNLGDNLPEKYRGREFKATIGSLVAPSHNGSRSIAIVNFEGEESPLVIKASEMSPRTEEKGQVLDALIEYCFKRK